jgi:peptidoglycan/xylan/chitin deacetylase (PgdA/CDA1 family)
MGSAAESLVAEEVLFQMGIPHYSTRSPEEATLAAMVLTSFGQVDDVGDDLVVSLEDYARAGGVVLAQKVRHPKLAGLFGYERAVPSRERHEIIWSDSPHPIAKYADAPEERVLRLGSYKHDEIFWTVGYSPEDARVLARFDDGTAAIIERSVGPGRAIALGGSLIDLVARSYLDRDFGVQKVGSNAFEPSTDSYLLLVKAAYETLVPTGFTIATTPPGTRGALILTHDIDALSSFDNMPDFAKVEKRFGVRSTVFVQTKYVRDYYDAPYMTVENLGRMRRLSTDGFEIGSHSVSHTPHFADLALGEPVHEPEGYHPRILSLSETVDATVRGEVAVSKRVLERDGIEGVRSFRSGHLHFNKYLVGALEEAGYLYDASMGVYLCACNFPFRQFRNRSFSTQSSIIEIPMTISDYDWVENLTKLTPVFKRIVLKNASNGAATTLLIHPTRKTDKLEALEQILTWLPDDIWVGTVAGYGQFWNSRYTLNPDISLGRHSHIIEFHPDYPTEKVTLHLNSAVDAVKAPPTVEVLDRKTLLLPAMAGGERLRIVLRHGFRAAGSFSIRSPGGPLDEDEVAYTFSLSAGAERYDDYDRQGEAPVVRGALSARKPLSKASGLKLWDYFASRTGEAEETQNQVGVTLDAGLSRNVHTWIRLANRTYKRKFTNTTIKFNEPRIELTLKRTGARATYGLDARYITAFYSSPDSISDKSLSEIAVEPAVRYRASGSVAFRIRGIFSRRAYGDENTADIYQTDFVRFGGAVEGELNARGTHFDLSTEWSVRSYTGDKDRNSLNVRTYLKTPLAAGLDFALRAGYTDAEFTESEYDGFYWGEALTSYSVSPSLILSSWDPVTVTLGATHRAEDYKRGPYNMQYTSAWLGFSTTW